MKLSIGKQVLLLVMSGSVMTFLFLGALAFYSISTVQHVVNEKSIDLDISVVESMGHVAEKQAFEQMDELARAKAQRIESEMSLISDGVRILSDRMSRILRAQGDYLPRALPNVRYQPVGSGEPYLFYNRSIESNLTSGLQREMSIAANFADALSSVANTVPYVICCYSGSKEGYVLRLDIVPDGNPVFHSEDFLRNYDPRTRLWYQFAQHAAKPVFTDMYLGTKGTPCITCAMPFYDNNGFAGVIGLDANLDAISQQVEGVAVGKSGFNFAMNPSGRVIFSSRTEGTLSANMEIDIRELEESSLSEAAKQMVSGEHGILPVTVDGEEYYLTFVPMKTIGWSFATLISQEEVLAPAMEARGNLFQQMIGFNKMLEGVFVKLFFGAAVLLLLLLLALCLVSVKLSRRFVEPIYELSDGVREIACGNLDKKLEIHTGDELEHLAVCFNAMTEELQSQIKTLSAVVGEKARIETELSVAERIQESILPRNFPAFPGRKDFDIYAAMRTAKEVGGDFYDFFLLDERHLFFTIADVSGKGVPASLFMIVSKTTLKNLSMTIMGEDGLADLMKCTNDRLCENNDAMMFVTCFIGMLDLQTGRIVYVNAGHNPPLAYSGGTGRFSYLSVNRNHVLGAMEGISFVQEEAVLAPGDLLFLYTDGVTEALNEKKELYSEERLEDCLNHMKAADMTLQDILAGVQDSIASHAGAEKQSDDITMMGIRYWGVKERERQG